MGTQDTFSGSSWFIWNWNPNGEEIWFGGEEVSLTNIFKGRFPVEALGGFLEKKEVVAIDALRSVVQKAFLKGLEGKPATCGVFQLFALSCRNGSDGFPALDEDFRDIVGAKAISFINPSCMETAILDEMLRNPDFPPLGRARAEERLLEAIRSPETAWKSFSTPEETLPREVVIHKTVCSAPLLLSIAIRDGSDDLPAVGDELRTAAGMKYLNLMDESELLSEEKAELLDSLLQKPLTRRVMLRAQKELVGMINDPEIIIPGELLMDIASRDGSDGRRPAGVDLITAACRRIGNAAETVLAAWEAVNALCQQPGPQSTTEYSSSGVSSVNVHLLMQKLGAGLGPAVSKRPQNGLPGGRNPPRLRGKR